MARSPAKRILGTILFLAALLGTAGFLFILYADSVNDDNVPYTDQTRDVALIVTIALGVIAFLLLILLFARRADRRQAIIEEAEVFFVPQADQPLIVDAPGTTFMAGPEVVVYNLRGVPIMPRAWETAEANGSLHPFYFPRSVESGLYVNDYVPIDGRGTRLKLRTLLAGPSGADQAAFPPGHERRPARITQTAPQVIKAGPRVVAATPVASSSGQQSFLQELETRLSKRTESPMAVSRDVHYDFAGDIHQVEDVEGIGGVFGEKLRAIGVKTTARLCYEEPGDLAQRIGVARTTVEQWQAMAQLMKIKGVGPQYAEALARAGVGGIEELKRRSAEAIAKDVNDYLDTLNVNVLGQKITPKRIEGWQKAAKPMKRVRQAIPAE
jgi:hypothetical protein